MLFKFQWHIEKHSGRGLFSTLPESNITVIRRVRYLLNMADKDRIIIYNEIPNECNGLSGKRFAKSQLCVVMDTASLFNLTLIKPYLTSPVFQHFLVKQNRPCVLGLPLDGKQWQSSTNPGSTRSSVSSRMPRTLASNSSSLTLGWTSETSGYSLLEYCSSAKPFC